MAWDFEQVIDPFETPGDVPDVTEGPVWTGVAVLFSDIPNSRVVRYDPRTDSHSVHREDTTLGNGLKLGPGGRLYACEQATHRVVRYDPDGGTTVVADSYDGTRLNAPNDLAIDDAGRVWFTDPYYGPKPESLELGHRSVYCAVPRGDGAGVDQWDLKRLTDDATNPNGILLSPEGRWLYVAELRGGADGDRELRAYPIEDGDDDITLGEYEVLVDFHPHAGIDGMCLDGEGNIVGAAGSAEDREEDPDAPGPALWVITPDGEVLDRHPFPGARPTNCAFGGPELETLYVTGFESGLHRAATDRTGHLGAPWRPGPVSW